MLDALDDFQRAIATLRDTLQGELRLGTILDPEFLRLGAALRHLMARYPNCGPCCATACPARRRGWCARASWTRDTSSARWTRRARSRRCTRPLAAFSYYVVAPKGWGQMVSGRGWKEIAALPWIWTPPDSVHHRLLARKFAELDAVPNAVAEVDQEASMLDLVRSGVGLSLARDSLALRESQTHGLLLVQGLEIRTELSFVCLASRSGNRWWRPPSTRCARPSPDMAAARLHAADNARAIRTADMTPRK